MLMLPKGQTEFTFTTGLTPSADNPWCKWRIANYKEVSKWINFSEEDLFFVDPEWGVTTTFLQSVTLVLNPENAPDHQQFDLVLVPLGGIAQAQRQVTFNLTLQ